MDPSVNYVLINQICKVCHSLMAITMELELQILSMPLDSEAKMTLSCWRR